MLDLSIVIAVKNEEKNLPELSSRLTDVTKNMKISHEVIFVTDINQDDTFAVLKSLHEKDKRIKTLKLSNSFGQYIAVMAGLNYAHGNAVVTMDGDLQDYPEDIPKLYDKLQEGYDVVYGVKDRKDESRLRNFLSKSFIKLLNLLSDYKLEHNTNIFRVMSRRTLREIAKFQEKEPSLTGITNLIGFPTAKVKVTSGKRKAGKTNYSFLKLFNLAVHMVLSFSTKPIRIISILGLLISFFSFLYLFLTLVYSLLYKLDPAGYPTIVSLILILGGMQLFAIGVIGEYIARVFMETKNRPLFIVENKIGDF